MEPFSTSRRELLTLPGALPTQALQPHLSLPFLQAQLLKQFLQKLAFRKDKQSFYLSCTAVTLHYVGKPERGLRLLRVSWAGNSGHTKQTNSGCLQGQRPCRETRFPIKFGETTRIFLKPRLFSHKMELWLCAFQRQVVDAGNAGCSCRVVNLCHHTLLSCMKRRGAHQALAITLCAQQAAQ